MGRIEQAQKESRTSESDQIPQFQLSEKHLKNAKLIVDRQKLLRLLPKNAIVAEIGVDKGDFTAEIIEICQPSKLHLIDMWGDKRYHEGKALLVEDKFKDLIAQKKVEINRGFSTAELAKFPDNYFDWVYIDTDHSYQLTIEELKICNRIVKENGIIAGHDFVQGNWDGGVRYGVVEAVYQLCVENDWEMVYTTTEPDHHRSFAIRKLVEVAKPVQSKRSDTVLTTVDDLA